MTQAGILFDLALLLYPSAQNLYYGLTCYYHPDAQSIASDPQISRLADRILSTSQGVRILNQSTPLSGGSPFETRGSLLLGCATILKNTAKTNVWPDVHGRRRDEARQEFVIAHELSHIRYHDVLMEGLFSGLVFYLAYGFPLRHLLRHYSYAVAIPIQIVVGVVAKQAFLLFCRFVEKRADLSGFSSCSKEAKIEGIRYLEECAHEGRSIRQENIDVLVSEMNDPEENSIERFATRWFLLPIYQWVYAENGDNRLDFTHPPISERIQYLTKAYEST